PALDMEVHSTRAEHPAGHSEASVKYCRLAIFNEELWHFRMEFATLLSLLEYYSQKDYRSGRLMRILNDACATYCENPANAATARAVLRPALAWRALDSALAVTAVGHAHIDLAWLWTWRETVRKGAGSFASQLRLMEKYPEYVFGASQAQLYQWMKEYYPALFEQIRGQIAEGRWEVQGGTWVECDLNVTSGESLARQFIHGKNFFRDNFGIEVRNLWEPDVFGCSAALPQFIQKAGCGFFLSTKLSWNKVNHFPYNTFRWRGIDGTEIPAHFPPEHNYCATMMAGTELAAAQDRFEEHDICPEFLSLFGVGDGGGGPKEEHVECAMLCRNLEGAPRVSFGTAQDFFDRLLADGVDKLPVWTGELYLEMHRGTLTSQARTKRNNRRCEQLLVAAEFIASCLPAREYPRTELDMCWKKLLRNQFHDILPGSAIHRVYEDAEREHAEIIATAEQLMKTAVCKLLDVDNKSTTLINTLSCRYARPVELPSDWAKEAITDIDGRAFPIQREADGRVFAAIPLESGEWKTVRRSCGQQQIVPTRSDGELILENRLVRYAFSENGRLLSAVWLADGRELLKAPGNALSLYADWPAEYDAWDVENYAMDEFIEGASIVAAAVRECGPVRSVLHFRLKIGESTITQEVSLATDSASLEFHTVVDWCETRKMLRVAFPTTIQSEEASFDIQYGFIRRPTHTNTSWDTAKFECCGQRYADLSCADWGVALMNDCKYGYRVREGVLDLNLLRSPKFPDYTADQGRQEFTYALLPHDGTLPESGVYAAAAQLNRSPCCFSGYAGIVEVPVRVEGDGLSLEVLKRAEQSDALILRIVETRGRKSKGKLRLASDDTTVMRTNLIEWTDEGEVQAMPDGTFPLVLKPFEILTLKLTQCHET
ncbi:MAG: alpha-mannosidase, partial [Victivallales bacterium]|nr:alpha-mannosidase [Victivallales bacterium]